MFYIYYYRCLFYRLIRFDYMEKIARNDLNNYLLKAVKADITPVKEDFYNNITPVGSNKLTLPIPKINDKGETLRDKKGRIII